MRTEEGQRGSFTVAFVDPVGPRRPRDEGPLWWPLRFAEPRLLSARELGKLRPAADPQQAFIGVGRRSKSRRKTLVIWGILVVGTSSWGLRHARTVRSTEHGPPYLKVHVTGPGRLSIHGTKGAMQLIGDEPADEPSVSIMALAWANTWRDVVGSVAGRATWPSYWARTVSVLLQFIRDSGHGGAVFIQDSGERRQQRPGLDMKYCIGPESALLRQPIIPLLDAEDEVNVAISADVAASSGESMQSVDQAHATVSLRRQAWLESIEAVARLVSVDGALIVARDLCIRGFGVVVPDVGNRAKLRVQRALDAEAQRRATHDFRGTGTRHRSAATFCADTCDSAAFVVSQDGEISAMRVLGETVLIWRVELTIGEE